jgi:hypothetical protein
MPQRKNRDSFICRKCHREKIETLLYAENVTEKKLLLFDGKKMS